MNFKTSLIIFKRLLKYFETLFFRDGYYPIRQFNNKKIIYIHINKTGGTSISKAIGMRRKIHRSAKKIKKIISPSDWKKSLIFTVVRNPYDRAYSQYFFEKKHREFDSRTKFDDWVIKNFNDKYPRKRIFRNPYMYKTQTAWVSVENKLVLSEYLKFENLKDDFDILKKKWSLNNIPNLTHENRINKPSVKLDSLFTKESLFIFNKFFKEDFKNFNYQICTKLEDLQ
jgi:chondroitin 4-sulfotransferase 11